MITISAAHDNIVQWWDTRNFSAATETVILDPENKDAESPGEMDRALTPCTHHPRQIHGQLLQAQQLYRV